MKLVCSLIALAALLNLAIWVRHSSKRAHIEEIAPEMSAPSDPRGVSRDIALSANIPSDPPTDIPSHSPSDRLTSLGSLDEVTCKAAVESGARRIQHLRELLDRKRPPSEEFAELQRNDTRVAEVSANVERLLGHPLGSQQIECRGPAGNVCLLSGLSEKDWISGPDKARDPWASATIQSMEVGRPGVIYAKVGPAGRQPGLPILREFVNTFKSSNLPMCQGKYPGAKGEILADIAIVDDDVYSGPKIHVDYLGGTFLNQYEECIKEALLDAATTSPVPATAAPVQLPNNRIGNLQERR